jgi:hypothetical protein
MPSRTSQSSGTSFPKVLLCEDGTGGHRPTILRYVTKTLTLEKIPFEISTEPQCAPARVCAEARAKGCGLVHYLTADGAIRKWWKRSPGGSTAIPSVATYYLFSNLQVPHRRIAIWFLCRRANVGRLMVSDDYLHERKPSMLGPNLHYLPDPWSAAEFPFVEEAEARSRMALRPNIIYGLMFGDLSSRKGFDTLLDALYLVNRPNLCVVAAGRVTEAIWKERGGQLRDAIQKGKLHLIDRFIEEREMTNLFYAVNVVLCPYPKYFRVSSNTATRAIAAGKPYLCYAGSYIAEVANREGVGVALRGARRIEELAVFLKDFECSGISSLDATRSCNRIRERRELKNYGRSLLAAYAKELNLI